MLLHRWFYECWLSCFRKASAPWFNVKTGLRMFEDPKRKHTESLFMIVWVLRIGVLRRRPKTRSGHFRPPGRLAQRRPSLRGNWWLERCGVNVFRSLAHFSVIRQDYPSLRGRGLGLTNEASKRGRLAKSVLAFKGAISDTTFR